MEAIYLWVSNIIGMIGFVAVLVMCVAAGQDLLMSTLKAMGVFFAVRIIGGFLAGIVSTVDQSQSVTGRHTEDEHH